MRKQSIVSGLLYALVIAVVVAVPVYYWYEIRNHPPSMATRAQKQNVWQDGYNIYLTAKDDNGVPANAPATTFSCSDKIYGVVDQAGVG